jgi:hypothetical protein
LHGEAGCPECCPKIKNPLIIKGLGVVFADWTGLELIFPYFINIPIKHHKIKHLSTLQSKAKTNKAN